MDTKQILKDTINQFLQGSKEVGTQTANQVNTYVETLGPLIDEMEAAQAKGELSPDSWDYLKDISAGHAAQVALGAIYREQQAIVGITFGVIKIGLTALNPALGEIGGAVLDSLEAPSIE